MDILALLPCLQPSFPATTLRPLSRIGRALLGMTGRLTMLGMARWAGKGGSSRTVQRFFATGIPWARLFWVFFRPHGYRSEEVDLRGGDEVVVTTAGKTTHGLDRFFASLYGKPVPGLACFALSWVSIPQRRSFPSRVEQVGRSEAEKAASKAKAAAKKRKGRGAQRRPGRPQGSKNKPHADGTFTPAWVRLTGWLDALLPLIAGGLSLPSLVRDGHFGHHHALQMARQCGRHLLAKRRGAAALYFPEPGPYAGRGPHRTYGHKGDDDPLPWQYLKETTGEGHIQTWVYQAQLLPKEFPQPLNVVIIAKTNLRTHARAHVVLFSRDLALADAPLVDY